MANLINTRICLRYDSYNNWKDSELILLAGEIAVAVPGDKLADVNVGSDTPCLIKVGDGSKKFSELPWLSALAADVHTWAKKSEADFKAWLVSETGPALATESDLTAAEGRILTLEGKVKTLEETTVPGLVTRIGTLETDMGTAKDDIADLKAAVGTGEGSLGATIEGLATRVGNAEQAITDHASEYSALAGRVTTAEGKITTLNGDKDTSGSVAYAVEQEAIRAKVAEKENSDAIAVLNGDANTDGSVAKAVKTAIDQEVTDRNSAIAGLKTELNNGTIKAAQDKADSAYTLADTAKNLADENKGKVNTLIGNDTGKSARTIANEELAAQLLSGKADADFKTLQELAAWLENHPESATEMNEAIEANADDISGLTEDLGKLTTRVGNNETAIGNINTKIGTEDIAVSGQTTLIGAINAIANADAGNHAATLKSAKDYTDAEVKKVTEAHASDLNALKSDVIGTPTTGKTIVEMIAAAEAAAKSHAETKASAAEANAKAHAETKAGAALTSAQAYTDAEIDKVESAIAAEAKARGDFDKTTITGTLSTADENGNQALALALNGQALEIVFVCGNASK